MAYTNDADLLAAVNELIQDYILRRCVLEFRVGDQFYKFADIRDVYKLRKELEINIALNSAPQQVALAAFRRAI